jgi:hypothetical protein
MSLGVFTKGKHDPTCTGCPACDERYAAMLGETPTQTAVRCASEIAASLRTASGFRAATFRVSQPRDLSKRTESEWRDEVGRRLRGYGSVQVGAPPDPYASATGRAPQSVCPFDDRAYNPRGVPADGYALALNRGKK